MPIFSEFFDLFYLDRKNELFTVGHAGLCVSYAGGMRWHFPVWVGKADLQEAEEAALQLCKKRYSTPDHTDHEVLIFPVLSTDFEWVERSTAGYVAALSAWHPEHGEELIAVFVAGNCESESRMAHAQAKEAEARWPSADGWYDHDVTVLAHRQWWQL